MGVDDLEELGVDFKEVGELIVAFDGAEVSRLVALKEEGDSLGVPRLKIVDRAWLARNEPNLSKRASAALYAPTAGIISPYRLVYDISENASRNGVEIRTNTRVEGITATNARPGAGSSSFEIRSSKGVFRARYVVNAAGLYADDIAGMVGVSDFRIRPRKGEEFLLDKKSEDLTRHLIFPLPTERSKGVLVIKTADGNPMIGPTADDVDDKEDLSTSDEGFKNVLRSAQRLVPAVNAKDIIAYFAGLRPVAGNDFIIRHEALVPGFFTVAGIQSPGLTAAPAIAISVREDLGRSGLTLEAKRSFIRKRRRTVHIFMMSPSRTKQLIAQDPRYGDIVCRCEMVSAKEIEDAILRGAVTLDGIKFRTRAQAGRCHGSFCTTRVLKILAGKTGTPLLAVTKRGGGSEIIAGDRADG